MSTSALTVIPENIPESLRKHKRWVGWRYEDRKGQPKPAKMPYSPDAPKGASSTAAADWTTFKDAVSYAQVAGLDGIMRAFDPADRIVGIDFDNCRDPETGELTERVGEYVKRLDTYTEVSPSGTGIKLWAKGTLPPYGRHRGDVEMYNSGRFFTMTGHHLEGTPCEVMYRPDAILAIHHEVWGDAPDLTITEDDPERPIPALAIGDEEVLRLASESAHNGERFRRLWSGDTSEYARDGNDGRNEADAALVELLAFYGGPDRERIERLFPRSGLTREKWEQRADYRKRTIDLALRGKIRFYGDSIQPTTPAPIGSDGSSGCACEVCPHRIEEARLRGLLFDRDDLIEHQQTLVREKTAELKERTAFLSNISTIIAKPNDELSPGEKVVSLGLLMEIHFRASASPYTLPDGSEGSYRTESGNVRMPREVIARRTGYSPTQASKIARQVAERENAPYKWSTVREWGVRQDGVEDWISKIEVQPLTERTADSLRAIAALPALPSKPKHGGSQQAADARDRIRRGCEHQDDDVIVSGICATGGEDLGDRRLTAQEWEALKHQVDVSEGAAPQRGCFVTKVDQVDVSDGQFEARAAALIQIPLTRDTADTWKQPTPKPANLGPILLSDRRSTPDEVFAVPEEPDWLRERPDDPPPPTLTCTRCSEPVVPGHKLYCAAHAAEADRVVMPWE